MTVRTVSVVVLLALVSVSTAGCAATSANTSTASSAPCAEVAPGSAGSAAGTSVAVLLDNAAPDPSAATDFRTVLAGAVSLGAPLMVADFNTRSAPGATAKTTLVGTGPNQLFRSDDLCDKERSALRGYESLAGQQGSGPVDAVAGIDALASRLHGTTSSVTDVVVFGSLVNTAAPVNLTTAAILASPSRVVAGLAARGLLPDCRAWRVYAIAPTPPSLTAEQTVQIEQFWRAFFVGCGGQLVDWEDSLTTFPKAGSIAAVTINPTARLTPTINRTKNRFVESIPSVLLFATGSAQLQAGASTVLGRVLALLREHPNSTAVIRGFTDDVGALEYNVTLASHRAQTVMTWLEQAGIAQGRLTATGVGARDYIASNATAAGRARNRRVTITVTGLGD